MTEAFEWFRKQAYGLAAATFTPIPFWLEMTPGELEVWIRDINAEQKKNK